MPPSAARYHSRERVSVRRIHGRFAYVAVLHDGSALIGGDVGGNALSATLADDVEGKGGCFEERARDRGVVAQERDGKCVQRILVCLTRGSGCRF